VPEPQYERKARKKVKTVVIAEDHEHEVKEIENTFNRTLVECSKKPVRSERFLPPVDKTIVAKVPHWRFRA